MALQNTDGFDNDTPLDEFDRAVLGVIISEYLAGNRYTTVKIIFRALIGKVADRGAIILKNQQGAIISSVLKLIGTIIDFSGVADSLCEMHYRDIDGNCLKFGAEALLSAGIVVTKINDQVMNGVIYFKDNSPLFDIADVKNQVIRYPHALLDVPNLNNTTQIISIKKYVLRRICEIKLHKQLAHTITFDDVFLKCRLSNCSRSVKKDARNAVLKLFHHLSDQSFIKSFEPVIQRQKFISVKFLF